MKIGKKIMIHGYKKNGWLYRTWEFPKIIEKNDEYLCVYLKNTSIITSEKFSKRNFHSKNLKDSYWFFLKDEWFNIVATVVDDNVSYYINLSSPFIIEEEAIKYIDFDIDVKIDQNGNFKILDKKEFDEHKKEFDYGNKLTKIIELECEKIIDKKFIDYLTKKINKDLLDGYEKRLRNE